MTCPSNSEIYRLEVRKSLAVVTSLEHYLGWNETLPLSVKYFFSGHVRVMYQETTSNMTRKQGISQGTQSKTKVKAPN